MGEMALAFPLIITRLRLGKFFTSMLEEWVLRGRIPGGGMVVEPDIIRQDQRPITLGEGEAPQI